MTKREEYITNLPINRYSINNNPIIHGITNNSKLIKDFLILSKLKLDKQLSLFEFIYYNLCIYSDKFDIFLNLCKICLDKNISIKNKYDILNYIEYNI